MFLIVHVFQFSATIQFLQYIFLIFKVFHWFLPYSMSYSLCVSFYTFFGVFCHNPGHTVFVSHFPCFSIFSPKSRSYSVYFSYFTFFTLSLHIPSHIVFVSHFPHFSVFFFFATIQFLQYLFLIFKVFHCFVPYSMSYSVCFSFHRFFSVSRHISCHTMRISLFLVW